MKVKIVTFVPIDRADDVRNALGDAGAGRIGEYSYCSFSVIGKGRFTASKIANPSYGEPGKAEIVEEERVEVECEKENAKAIITAMKKVHPYEEVAFDIYPLLSEEDL
jgi:hypothetical protein